MEIKVGDYIRTKAGYIGEVININDFRDPGTKICVDFNLSDYIFIGEKDIKKHSQNIIDLVEVKDVIRYKIHNISTTLETKGYIEGVIEIRDKEMIQRIKEDKDYEILEILTHELYEENCYKVGGREDE